MRIFVVSCPEIVKPDPHDFLDGGPYGRAFELPSRYGYAINAAVTAAGLYDRDIVCVERTSLVIDGSTHIQFTVYVSEPA